MFESWALQERSKQVVAGSCAMAVLLILVGFTVQDWSGPASAAPAGNPWGTLLTAAALCVEAGAMATTAPSSDGLRLPFQAAWGLSSIGWFCGFLLHQQFFQIGGSGAGTSAHDGPPHWLLVLAPTCIGVGGLWLGYVALVAANAGSWLASWPEFCRNETILKGIFGVWTAVYVCTLLGYISLPIIVVANFKVVTCIIISLVGVSAKKNSWVVAVVTTFTIAFLIEHFSPKPFSTSHTFDAVALINGVLMLYMAMVYGLIQAVIYGHGKYFSALGLGVEGGPIDMTVRREGCCDQNAFSTQPFDAPSWQKAKRDRICTNFTRNCTGLF